MNRRAIPRFGLAVSLALHAVVLTLATRHLVTAPDAPAPAADELPVIQMTLMPRVLPVPPNPPAPAHVRPEPTEPAPTIAAMAPALHEPDSVVATDTSATPRPLASMNAPPAPTAEEWAFAARYTRKNSKGYRHTWGQQVRSMMGTAVEGPDQGSVRFRVEIGPDGILTRLETLWSTSPVAEQLARQAITSLPRWPPTPTGKPLIFEKTISFTPYATDGPPIYKDDCLPDPPAVGNPYAWDGRSDRAPVSARTVEPPDPQALEDCRKQLPQDSIEAESARDQRLMDQWGWGASKLGR
jgi:hypothetical protein